MAYFGKSLWLLIAGISLLLSGCVTPLTRSEMYKDKFNALSAEHQAKVLDGEIDTGMSTDAVLIALGKPTYRRPGEFKGQPMLGWVYTRIRSSSVTQYRPHIYFNDKGEPLGNMMPEQITKTWDEPRLVVYFQNDHVVGWQDLLPE